MEGKKSIIPATKMSSKDKLTKLLAICHPSTPKSDNTIAASFSFMCE